MRGTLAAGLLAVTLAACDSSTAPINRDPEAARLVFDDIPRFWHAFDEIANPVDTTPLRKRYLDSATIGLRDFTALRWKNSATLTQMVWGARNYYASVKPATLTLSSTVEPEVRAAMRALAQRYADAVFPDVYFCVGGMSTGGTISEHGLLIGVELFSDGPSAVHSELSAWQLSVIRPPSVLPAIVAHELTHYQQKVHNGTLLAKSILEGSADFVGELLTGSTINEPIHVYGDAHEAELWSEFKLVMNGNNTSQWLYNGGVASSRPADLGYYIGYKITEAYWNTKTDKIAALKDILTVTDFPAFLAASGYNGGQ